MKNLVHILEIKDTEFMRYFREDSSNYKLIALFEDKYVKFDEYLEIAVYDDGTAELMEN